MEEEYHNFELIEAYVEGRMTAEEQVEFETRLQLDERLLDEYEVYKKLRASFLDIHADRLKERFKRLDEELDRTERVGRGASPGMLFLLKVAAAISVFSIAAWIVISLKDGRNSDLATYIPVEEGLPVLMSPVEQEKPFADAMTQFKLENYKSSRLLFKELLTINPDNDTLSYYAGYSSLKLKDYDQAANCFRDVISKSYSVYHKKAQFCLALSYWGKGDQQNMQEIIVAIFQDNSHHFYHQALEIRGLLKSV